MNPLITTAFACIVSFVAIVSAVVGAVVASNVVYIRETHEREARTAERHAAELARSAAVEVLAARVGTPLRGHLHQDVRNHVVSMQMRQMRGDHVLVVGDTVAESAFLDVGCVPVVNGAIGGSVANNVAALVGNWVGEARPAHLVVALGMNHVYHLPSLDERHVRGFLHGVDEIVGIVGARSASLVLVTPVEGDAPGAARSVDQLNAAMREHAAARGLGIVDAHAAVTAGPGPYTLDGVNPTPEALARWSAAVSADIAANACRAG